MHARLDDIFKRIKGAVLSAVLNDLKSLYTWNEKI